MSATVRNLSVSDWHPSVDNIFCQASKHLYLKLLSCINIIEINPIDERYLSHCTDISSSIAINLLI